MLHINTLQLCTVILFWIQIEANEAPICPIGFHIAYTKKEDPICFRLKGPESFNAKFDGCVGNLYTSKLFSSLNISSTKINVALWAEYKSLYPGGPFIDMSYTQSIGDPLITTNDVKYDASFASEDELCVVMDPVSNFTATRCDEKHYRYCFVRPLPEESDRSGEGCEDEYGPWTRFWSPRSTCLVTLTGAGGGTVRATWKQAQALCAKKKASILHRGWRYAKYPYLHLTDSNWTNPIGSYMSPQGNLFWYDFENSANKVADSEWDFGDDQFSNDSSLVALSGDSWHLVNQFHLFYDVICEKPVLLKPVVMNLTIDLEGKLILSVNDSIDEQYIHCFTDSVIFYPSRVKFTYDEDNGVFILKPISDGYYWCLHNHSFKYHITQSNKALFIREKQSVVNLHVVRIHLKKKYRFESLEKVFKVWEKKLRDYIYYYTSYVKSFGIPDLSDPINMEKTLKQFKGSNPGLSTKDTDVIYMMKLKRVHMDGRSALLHIQLNPDMTSVPRGLWEDLEVVYMKPAYYCRGFDSVPMLPLGESKESFGCRTHSCVGDFDEGVQWVTTATDHCTTRPPQLIETVSISLTTQPTSIHQELSRSPSISEDLETNTSTRKKPWRPTTTTAIPTVVITDGVETVSTAKITTEETSSSSEESMDTSTLTSTSTKFYPTTTIFSPDTTSTTMTTNTPITTTLMPSEAQLQDIIEDLEALVFNDSVSFFVKDVEQAFDKVDVFLEDQENLAIPGNLLALIDTMGERTILNGSQVGTAVRNNIAMVMADANPEMPVRGLRIASIGGTGFTDGDFQILRDEVNSTLLKTDANEAVVTLPESISNETRRISFVVFRNDRAFHSNTTVFAINSKVLSVNVQDVKLFQEGEVVDIHIKPQNERPDNRMRRACAYWHFNDDGTGYWSEEGCEFIRASRQGLMDTCRCNHLTHFAEILAPKSNYTLAHETALEVISFTGLSVSLVGLILIVITAILFRSWRRDFSNKIWLQLCISILFVAVCFLLIGFQRFDQYNTYCMLIGVALHYSVLASFCWMLVAAVLSYRRLVLVFTRDASHKLLRAAAFAWGAPCAIVGVLLAVQPQAYAGRFESQSLGGFCFPDGVAHWVTVYTPIFAILLANWTLFALIVRSVFASRRIQRHGDSNEALRCASVSCLLVFLFGLPWVFGLFIYNLPAAYIFCLTTTLQGFILFLFFVIGNKKTRELWMNKLKIKQTRKVPVTSSSFTNKSSGSGTGWRGASARGVTLETTMAKPRSLSSVDDSRFS